MVNPPLFKVSEEAFSSIKGNRKLLKEAGNKTGTPQ